MRSLRLTDGSTMIWLDNAALGDLAVIEYALKTPEVDVSSEADIGDGDVINGVRYRNVAESAKLWFPGATADLRDINRDINRLLHQARVWQTERRGRPVYIEQQVVTGDPWYRSEVLYGRAELDEGTFAPGRIGGTSNDWLFLGVEWTRRFYWEASDEEALPLTNGSGSADDGLTIYNHDDAGSGHDHWFTIAADDIVGDLPAAVRLALTNTTTSVRNSATFWIGRSTSTYGTSLILEGEDATLVGGSTASDADCSGGSKASVTVGTSAAVVMSWDIDASALEALAGGWYRLLLRTENTVPGEMETVRLRVSALAGVTALARTNWFTTEDDNGIIARQLYDLGALQLPPGTGAVVDPAELTLHLEAWRPSSVTMQVDFLALIPMEAARKLTPRGYYVPEDATLVDDSISGQLYVDGGDGRRNTYVAAGAPLVVEPGVRNTFYVLCNDSSAGSAIDRTHSVTLTYRPRRLTI